MESPYYGRAPERSAARLSARSERIAMKTAATLLFLAAAASAAPTYNKDIAPIFYKNCAGCHRPGEVAPFPLLSYQDTAKRAALIAGITKSRVMPPWKAEPGYGEFRDERRLTDKEIDTIQQ